MQRRDTQSWQTGPHAWRAGGRQPGAPHRRERSREIDLIATVKGAKCVCQLCDDSGLPPPHPPSLGSPQHRHQRTHARRGSSHGEGVWGEQLRAGGATPGQGWDLKPCLPAYHSPQGPKHETSENDRLGVAVPALPHTVMCSWTSSCLSGPRGCSLQPPESPPQQREDRVEAVGTEAG